MWETEYGQRDVFLLLLLLSLLSSERNKEWTKIAVWGGAASIAGDCVVAVEEWKDDETRGVLGRGGRGKFAHIRRSEVTRWGQWREERSRKRGDAVGGAGRRKDRLGGREESRRNDAERQKHNGEWQAKKAEGAAAKDKESGEEERRVRRGGKRGRGAVERTGQNRTG